MVSRVTIYRALSAARGRLFRPETSVNNRFKQARYGMKRLAKVEKVIQEKLKQQAKRYNKSYPGEMVHADNKRLPLLKGQKPPTGATTYLSPLMTFPANCMPPFCRTRRPIAQPNFCGSS